MVSNTRSMTETLKTHEQNELNTCLVTDDFVNHPNSQTQKISCTAAERQTWTRLNL